MKYLTQNNIYLIYYILLIINQVLVAYIFKFCEISNIM